MVKIADGLQGLCNQVFRWIPQSEPTPESLKDIQIVAHRGCWNSQERLENTMAAFLETLHHKIWAIEFDLRFTADNVPVVHHDATTERVFKKSIAIDEVRFEFLRSEIPQIPTLQEVIETMGDRIHFFIELKTLCNAKQAQILRELLQNLRPIEDFHFMSLELERFKPLQNYRSQCFVSIARTNIIHFFKKTTEMQLGALTGQYLLLTDSMKETCHQQGIKVGTGFPDSKNLFYREANRHVDWVFTNHAIQLAQWK